MSSFFEKLKKGMDVENYSNEKEIKEDIDEKTKEEKQEEIEIKDKENKKEKILDNKTKEEIQEFENQEIKNITKEKNKEELKKEEEANSLFEKEGQLAVDVFETDKDIVIQTAIAGVKPQDLDISIENDIVSIKGKREKIYKEENENYFFQECYWGKFSRQIILPEEVDPSRAEATMKNGILVIKMPKIEKEKKRKIEIK